MSRYIDADALIKRIQDEHKFGSLMLSNMIAEMPKVDEYEIAKNYCKSRCLTMIDTLFLKEIFNLGHADMRGKR